MISEDNLGSKLDDAKELLDYAKKFEKVANSISTYCEFKFKKITNYSAALIADDIIDPVELADIIKKVKLPNNNSQMTIECIEGNPALFFTVGAV